MVNDTLINLSFARSIFESNIARAQEDWLHSWLYYMSILVILCNDTVDILHQAYARLNIIIVIVFFFLQLTFV